MSNVFKLKKDLVDMVPWDEYDDVVVLGRRSNDTVAIWSDPVSNKDLVYMSKCLDGYVNTMIGPRDIDPDLDEDDD